MTSPRPFALALSLVFSLSGQVLSPRTGFGQSTEGTARTPQARQWLLPASRSPAAPVVTEEQEPGQESEPASQAGRAGEGNLISNGSFEKFIKQDNVWDGVDSGGFLAGERRSLPALTEEGSVADLPMPVSVNFIDINQDARPDLVTADPAGFFRAYFNSGTKTEPKFTHAESIPLFLSRRMQAGVRPWPDPREPGREGTKLHLHDWNRRGVLDLIVGNYAGEIMLIPNRGSAAVPDWRQPRIIDDVLVKTRKEGQLWGNLFAPWAMDWDGDGRTDLLVGEGSYSANAVHLLLNRQSSPGVGAGAKPEFSAEHRHYLAFGDGREHLAPTTADFNGDGRPDLLVGDRGGTVALHLHPGEWKTGAELPLASLLKLGKSAGLGACIAPYAADWNGDGLCDLIIGRTSGRISVSLNSGTREQPRFGAPSEVRGTDLWGPGTVNAPAGWTFDAGAAKGNLYAFVASVDASQDGAAAPADGSRCLKAGYFPSPNRILKKPVLAILPATPAKPEVIEVLFGRFRARSASIVNAETGTHHFVLGTEIKTALRPGADYVLSFKIKGRGVREGTWALDYAGMRENAPARIDRGERGAATISHDVAREIVQESGTLTPGPGWTEVTRTFRVRFRDDRLNALKTTSHAALQLRFTLEPYESVLYLDEVRLIERG